MMKARHQQPLRTSWVRLLPPCLVPAREHEASLPTSTEAWCGSSRYNIGLLAVVVFVVVVVVVVCVVHLVA